MLTALFFLLKISKKQILQIQHWKKEPQILQDFIGDRRRKKEREEEALLPQSMILLLSIREVNSTTLNKKGGWRLHACHWLNSSTKGFNHEATATGTAVESFKNVYICSAQMWIFMWIDFVPKSQSGSLSSFRTWVERELKPPPSKQPDK